MSLSPCPKAVLVAAWHDGRLGPDDVASLERHVRACEECATLRGELREIRNALRAPGSAPTPLEHQRARLALLRTAAGGGASTRASSGAKRWPVLAAAVLATATAAAAATTWVRHRTETSHGTGSPATSAVATNAPAVTAPPLPVVAPPASSPVVDPPAMASVAAPPPSVHEHPAPHASVADLAATASPSAAPSAAPATASRDFAAAMDALGRGDFALAARRFDEVQRDYPNDPLSDEAQYLVAISLERADRTSEARAAAERYLRERPTGAHRSQAAELLRAATLDAATTNR